jgi:hypothetical protein
MKGVKLLFKDKRGISIPLFVLGELMVLGLISFVLFNNVFDVIDQDQIFRTTTHEDFRMMIDTLVALPGDAVVKYPEDLSEYNIIIQKDQNRITMFKAGDEQLRKKYKYFFLPDGYEARGLAEQEAEVCLTKTRKTIVLGGCDES